MKNAVVTGGTKGIGFAIVEMLLKEGYFVTITYCNDDEGAKVCASKLISYNNNFEIIKVNQSDKDDISFLSEHVLKKNHIDCIVLNVGKTLRKPFQDITDSEWEDVMMTNVNSNVYFIRNIIKVIPPNSRIIFIGSMMAVYPHGTSLSYGVTKSALHALSLNLVKCFEGTGTTVNTIAPGFVDTDWQKDKPKEIRQSICDKTAVKRFATVDEIADAVKFCINNSFVNGSVIEVSGGYCFK